MFLLLPFDSLIVNLLGISLTVLFTLLLVFIIVPAIFGVSFGIRKLYMKTLLKIFAVSCAVYNGSSWRRQEVLLAKSCFYLVNHYVFIGMKKVGRMGRGILSKKTHCVLLKAFSSLSF